MAEEWLKFIPLDKSWIIRMGILDLTKGRGSDEIVSFLNNQKDLGEDVKALKRVAEVWGDVSKPLDVGESGTVFRLVRFYLWKNGINRELIARGTLPARIENMRLDPDLVNWPLKKLLTLEGGTTQWATAAILFGNTELLPEVSFYLQKTYDAIQHWVEQRKLGKSWIAQTDPTLTAQCREYLSFLRTGKINILPDRLGDCDLYCFLRAFNSIITEEGKRLWPQLQGHESDRFLEMDRTLIELEAGKMIQSKDHRVVQAEAMVLQSSNKNLSIEQIKQRFDHPDCVNKTWPLFWDFMKYCEKFR